jgi:hypothetical protein
MSGPDDILPHRQLRVMQIIAGAILLGAVIFLVIVLTIVLVRAKGPARGLPGNLPMISIVAVVFLAVTAPLAFIVPGFQTRAALRQIASGTWQLPLGANAAGFSTDASKLLAVQQNAMVVGLALLEGTAFFGCIAYLVEAQPFACGLVVLAVILMLLKFPTEGRVRAWLEHQADQLVELRQQGSLP